MRALSLFSGIGGLDLAAEWAGIEPVAFCEIDGYASGILERRWRGVKNLRDIRYFSDKPLRELGGSPYLRFRTLADYRGTIDVIHGGFPCQDLSVAGKQAGLTGERSGLWFEMLRVIAGIRPRFVVAENVRGAVNLALDTVKAGLENEGYEVWALVLPASAVGAPHQRERLFVVGVRSDVADGLRSRGPVGLPGPLQGEEGEPAIPLNDGSPSGSLWPTPHRNCSNGAGAHGEGGLNLQTAVKAHAEQKGRWGHAKTRNGLGGEILRGLRKADGKETLQELPGGPETFREQAVLQSSMCREGPQKRESDKIGDWEEIDCRAEGLLRDVWGKCRATGASFGREPLEQFFWELNDRLHKLPYEVALGTWEVYEKEISGLCCVRCGKPCQDHVSKALAKIQEIWRSADEKGEGRESVCINKGRQLGPCWTEILLGYPIGWTDVDCETPEPWPGWPALMGEPQYPYEPPRTVTGCKNRAKRLKCLGNSVVPQQAYPLFRAIAEMEAMTP